MSNIIGLNQQKQLEQFFGISQVGEQLVALVHAPGVEVITSIIYQPIPFDSPIIVQNPDGGPITYPPTESFIAYNGPAQIIQGPQSNAPDQTTFINFIVPYGVQIRPIDIVDPGATETSVKVTSMDALTDPTDPDYLKKVLQFLLRVNFLRSYNSNSLVYNPDIIDKAIKDYLQKHSA